MEHPIYLRLVDERKVSWDESLISSDPPLSRLIVQPYFFLQHLKEVEENNNNSMIIIRKENHAMYPLPFCHNNKLLIHTFFSSI